MLKRRFILSLLAPAALALTAAVAPRAQSSLPQVTEEFHQTYPLAADGRVSLSNINGNVRVSAWDRSEVRVDAVKRAYAPERLQEVRIEVDASPSSLRIETKYPDYSWRSDRERDRRDEPASVEYTLTVPRGASLEDVSLINGGLNIEGLAGAVHASSVNGRVTARGLTGTVNLSVVNGGLDATLDRLNESGTVSLSAVNGPLVVTIPSDANATIRASTVSGPIRNDFNLPVREGEYVGRDLEGRIGQGAARVHLSNVNGSVSIRRADDNRPPSPVTNLLSEASRDDDDQDREDAREAREEARQEREAARAEARASRRESERETEEAAQELQRETERAARDAEKASREAAKEAAKIDKEQLKESIKEGVRAGAVRDDSRRLLARESNSFAVTGAPRVRVETFDGPIYVHAWDKPEVMYTATKRASDEREMQGIRLTAQGGGSEVTLRADFDKSHARAVEEREGRVVSFSSNASAEFDVYVPRSAALFVSTGDGRVRVEDVGGELDVRTGDGSIDVTGARGRLRADTGDGRIRIEGFDGDAEARTGDGGISLDGNFRTLSARTGDGPISLSVADGTNATVETDAESVFNDGVAVAETPNSEARVRRWRIGGGGQLFTLRTGDGRIALRRR
jgi:DUF4097 and DUF4098 domain-containing protein YvlB